MPAFHMFVLICHCRPQKPETLALPQWKRSPEPLRHKENFKVCIISTAASERASKILPPTDMWGSHLLGLTREGDGAPPPSTPPLPPAWGWWQNWGASCCWIRVQALQFPLNMEKNHSDSALQAKLLLLLLNLTPWSACTWMFKSLN